MALKRQKIAFLCLLATAGSMMAQDYFDDIYYNPKKDNSVRTTTVTTSRSTARSSTPTSTYIADMGNMDVDAYNRRGSQYYVSSIDTIGSGVENGEDFVYTQQIQKYYNPTIVVENASNLGDVLANARGNVDIVINNNGYPVFAPYYGWNWPYYSSYWPSWSWGWNIGGWGWSVGWYDPWFSWNWGPGWWNPIPGPGPGWWNPGPGPGWGPPRPGPGNFATWSPGGNRPIRPQPSIGFRQPTRANSPVRPGMGVAHRPSNPGMNGVVNNGGRWQYKTPPSGQHRGNASVGVGNNKGNSRPGVGTPGGKAPQNNKSNVGKSTSTQQRNVGNSRSNSSYRQSGASSGSRSSGGSRGGGGGGRHR